MATFLMLVLSIWLTAKFIGIMLRITWGATKLVASLLFAVALPGILLCALFAGGFLLLLPIALLGLALAVAGSAV